MGRCTPCEETLETILEDEYYSNPTAVLATQTQYLEQKDLPRVESAKVVCHQRKRKAGPVNVFRRAHIRGQVQLFDLLLRYDLLKKPAPPTLSTPCFEGRLQDCHCSLGEETVLQRVPIFFAA